MSSNKQPTDWDAIERDYRSGSMSNRELARWHGVSEGMIRKRAKAENWVRTGAYGTQCVPAERLVRPHAPRGAPADIGTIVAQGRDLVLRLLGELDAVTAHQSELEEMIELETMNDMDGRRRSAMLKAIALPSRAAIMKNLAAAAKTLADTRQTDEAADSAGAGKPGGAAENAWDGLLQ